MLIKQRTLRSLGKGDSAPAQWTYRESKYLKDRRPNKERLFPKFTVGSSSKGWQRVHSKAPP